MRERAAVIMIVALITGVNVSTFFVVTGCNTPPIKVDAPVTAPINARATIASPEMTVTMQTSSSQPTSQTAAAGDTPVSGTGNVGVGGGNAINLDGGTIIALAAIIVPCVIVAYLIAKGGLKLTTDALAKRADNSEVVQNAESAVKKLVTFAKKK